MDGVILVCVLEFLCDYEKQLKGPREIVKKYGSLSYVTHIIGTSGIDISRCR